jgi:hypothetical protein
VDILGIGGLNDDTNRQLSHLDHPLSQESPSMPADRPCLNFTGVPRRRLVPQRRHVGVKEKCAANAQMRWALPQAEYCSMSNPRPGTMISKPVFGCELFVAQSNP